MNRGGDLPPVQSCEGLGDPAYFYLSGVWTFAGMTAFLIFVIASYLRYINCVEWTNEEGGVGKALFFPKFSERLSSFPLSEVNGKYSILFQFPFIFEISFLLLEW